MIDKYEAAELFVIGSAKDVILGEKTIRVEDNASGDPEFRVDSLALFDE